MNSEDTKRMLLDRAVTTIQVETHSGSVKVKIRELNLDTFANMLDENEGKTDRQRALQSAQLIAACVCDDDGETFMTPNEVLRDMPYSVIDQLVTQIVEATGLNGADLAAVGNLPSVQRE